MSRHDGGPAFPGEQADRYWLGMSLRDFFAGQAMTAYLTSPVTAKDATDHADRCAEWAYLQANAMLKERARQADE